MPADLSLYPTARFLKPFFILDVGGWFDGCERETQKTKIHVMPRSQLDRWSGDQIFYVDL